MVQMTAGGQEFIADIVWSQCAQRTRVRHDSPVVSLAQGDTQAGFEAGIYDHVLCVHSVLLQTAHDQPSEIVIAYPAQDADP
jgi:hypothetical protein